MLKGKFGASLPFFSSSTHGKFSYLSSLFAFVGEPSIKNAAKGSNDGTNPSSKDSSNGYIESHDFIIILSCFVVGYAVVYFLLIVFS